MSPRKKILMLTTQLGYGGAETSFIRLANFLAQTMEVTVALFTSNYGTASYSEGHEPLNATIMLLDHSTPCGQLRRWLRRVHAMRQLKPHYDAAISFLSGPNLVNVLAGSHARSIVSLRGSRTYDPVAPKFQRLLFHYVLDPIIFRLAARIVPVSAGLKHEMSNTVRAKVVAIPPFIETESMQQKLQEPAPTPYATLKGQPTIIAVGRLSVEKGFQHLIRVFSQLVKHHPGAKLLLVGDGPMLQQLRTQCTQLGLAQDEMAPETSAVLFAGYQKNVLPLMALARVFALTSATEGFPSVLLEGMIAGVPVIAADTPWGARTILAGSETAEPYPTTKRTTTAYGTLMPRIDLPHHEALWVSTLGDYLRDAPEPSEKAAMRPADFDSALVGEQWKRLIEVL